MIEQYLLYGLGFALLCIFQAYYINGFYEACKGGCVKDMIKGEQCSGNIFWKINPAFFEKNKNKTWALPLFGCVKCMSSVHGAITYFPTVIYLFKFHWIEIPIFIADVFILVSLNWQVYKKL